MNRLFVVTYFGTIAVIACCCGCNITATGHNMQGKRLFEQGQFAAALTSFQKALEDNPRSADAYYNMAATYYHLGKEQQNSAWLQQSDYLYRQAINLDPQHTDAYRGLAVQLADSGRSAEAFQLLENWRSQSPRSAEPMIELSRLYREAGDRQRSMQLLVDALNIDSTNYRALRAMGKLREETGEYQLALDNYIRSYQSNNLQADVAERIAALEGRVQAHPVPFQPGQTRMGSAQQYVPR